MAAPALGTLLDQLLARTGQGAKLGLERTREALAALGDPQEELAVVHIAGTNGKGSTAAMVDAIARAAGLRSGLYTSPHLSRFSERIAIDGQPIGDALFADALERALDPALPSLSFFEVLTVAALWAMRRAEVDLAVLEVGLGGRLDATNVIRRPRAAAVTSIGLDHQHFLGSTLASIAREKAAIAKRGAPLVLGALPVEALDAVLEVAERRGATPVWSLSEATRAGVERLGFRVAGDRARLELPSGAEAPLAPALAGAHQLGNAAVAAALAWHALGPGDRWRSAVIEGLPRARWPGRLERIAQGAVTVVLDCAHNEEAAATLARALADEPPATAILLFGALADKPWPSLLRALAPLARERIYCEPLAPIAGRRSVAPEVLSQELPGMVASSPGEALSLALARARPGDRVIVAGSAFLVGALRARLLAEPHDVLVPL
jgi:dihydrofolate synthase/folylpolyglutamate synthase